MGRQELDDVTSQRLKMRPDIEKEIESVVHRCGFRRVSLDEMCANEKKKCNTASADVGRDDATTTWNRHMHLYERIL